MKLSTFSLSLVCLAAAAAEPAQSVAPIPGTARPLVRIDLPPAAPRFERRAMRPDAERLSVRMARELEQANTMAASRMAALAAPGVPPSGPGAGGIGPIARLPGDQMPCVNRIQAVDNQAGAAFRLQPGQNLLITGCFNGAPPTSVTVRHEGAGQTWQAALIQAGAQFVFARLPDVTGVPDGNVALSVGFADGTQSNTVRGAFAARRQTYELSRERYPTSVLLASGVSEVCSFQSCYWDSPGQSLNQVYVQRTAPTLSEHRFSARKPGYQVVGYLVGLLRGTVADGGFGTDGSVVVRFGTEAVSGNHVSHLQFDRIYIEGPAGLVPW